MKKEECVWVCPKCGQIANTAHLQNCQIYQCLKCGYVSGVRKEQPMTTPGDLPAFPHVAYKGAEKETGMTLRDYFAGQALIAIIKKANPGNAISSTQEYNGQNFAKWSYEFADAMIKARADATIKAMEEKG